MKQVSAYHSRQRLVPSLRRPVQSGRWCATGNSPRPVSFSTNPLQARTASSATEPHVRHGTSDGMLQADTRRAVYPRPSNCTNLKMWGEMTPVEFQAFMEEKQQQKAEVEELRQQGLWPWYWIRVRLAAEQILLRACSFKQEHGMTPSEFFAQAVAANDSGLQRVAASLGLELAQLGQVAEAVLANYHSLDGEVRLDYMKPLEYCVYDARLRMHNETLQQLYPHQCRVVHAYEVIKEAVPERFT